MPSIQQVLIKLVIINIFNVCNIIFSESKLSTYIAHTGDIRFVIGLPVSKAPNLNF